jgi:uncharacterized protein
MGMPASCRICQKNTLSNRCVFYLFEGGDQGSLVNLRNQNVLAGNVQQAYTFLRRFKGLMFTNEFPSGNSLHIKPCNSIHTFFMKYKIDILFLDDDKQVIDLKKEMMPGKLSVCKKASSVIELPAGTIDKTETQVGDYIQF